MYDETEIIMRRSVLVEIRAGEGGDDAKQLINELKALYVKAAVRL